MQNDNKTKYTPAQKMCYQQFIPYINSFILEAAPMSYLTSAQIEKNWSEIIPWNDKFADELVFQSKSFFLKKIKPDSSYSHEPDILNELVDNIIEYIVQYFMRAPKYQNNENAAREFLIKKLKIENAYLAHARMRHQKIQEKRELRAANQAKKIIDTPIVIRTSRPRISINKQLDEIGKIKSFMHVNINKTK